MIKITKFGGSSVANAAQFKKVKGIVEADPSRQYVVVSAAGKRFSGDNKVTDLLYLVNAHITYHVDCSPILNELKARFVEIAETLEIDYPIGEKFDEFAAGIKSHTPEFIVSRGEWFTAQLMAAYLGMPFLDAADVIVFHHDGTINAQSTDLRLRDAAQRMGKFVIPGFYGSTVDGEVMLFGRGGGDITGSILARALDADLYENWTDVSGFLSADPRIVDSPHHIKQITFEEMRELSYMGASVLHEEAIFPVRDANIPIVIKNTNRPEDEGTIIREKVEVLPDDPTLTGIAGKRDFISIHIKKTRVSDAVGVVRRTLGVFERYGVSVEHIPTGIDSFGIVINSADVRNSIYSLVSDIQKEITPDEIKVVSDLAIISVVGRGMSARTGTAGKLFGALGAAGINVRLITQSSEEINIILGVANFDFERAIRVIYETFFTDEEN